MKDDSLDEEIEKIMNQDTAQSKAVGSLIDFKEPMQTDLFTDIERKTQLDDSDCCLHTQADILGHIIVNGPEKFKKLNLLGIVVAKKECKLLSNKRESRKEIVRVAMTPDTNIMDGNQGGFFSNMFRPRKRVQY